MGIKENNVYLYAHLIEHNGGIIHGRLMAPAIGSRKEQEGARKLQMLQTAADAAELLSSTSPSSSNLESQINSDD